MSGGAGPVLTLSSSRPLVPSKSAVDSAEERAEYASLLAEAWGVPKAGRRRLPRELTSNPVSLSKANLGVLREGGGYVVGHKSDGVRYALFLFLRPSDGTPAALMVDRAGSMYEVDVAAPEEYFARRTLFEGELVWRQPDERAMIFAVFDVLLKKGRRLAGRPFAERIREARVSTLLSAELSLLPSVEEVEMRCLETDTVVLLSFDPPILMEPKHFVDLRHAGTLWASRGECKHRTDGLIVHSASAAYKPGPAFGCVYKWKSEHTVDLKGVFPDWTTADGGRAVDKVREMGFEAVLSPSRVQAATEDDIVEYHLSLPSPSSRRLHFFAMRSRPDKCFANSSGVLRSTLEDALSPVTADELARAGEAG